MLLVTWMTEIKPIHTVLPKTEACVRSFDDKTKSKMKADDNFFKMIAYSKNILIFGIKSGLVLKKNLMVYLSIKNF